MIQSLSFAEAHERARINPGVTLFTISIVTADRHFVTRAYTSHEEVYPLGGLKPVGAVDPNAPTAYHPNRAAIVAVFPEQELILSLGGSAGINVPVVENGELIAAVNFVHDENVYSPAAVVEAEAITQALMPTIHMFRKSQH